MAWRHIIVEGPDGAGKSTLIKYLSRELGYPVYPKMADSVEGPDYSMVSIGGYQGNSLGIGTQLDQITTDTVLYFEYMLPHIFDRFSVISELIYGPLCRKGLKGWFNQPEWVTEVETLVRQHCHVVWCIPPVREVVWNVTDPARGKQMSGVKENIRAIYQEYVNRAATWEGSKSHYDYTSMKPKVLAENLKHLWAQERKSNT